LDHCKSFDSSCRLGNRCIVKREASLKHTVFLIAHVALYSVTAQTLAAMVGTFALFALHGAVDALLLLVTSNTPTGISPTTTAILGTRAGCAYDATDTTLCIPVSVLLTTVSMLSLAAMLRDGARQPIF
jgi:hypothetical protein